MSLAIAAGLGSALLGYKAQKDANSQTEAQNALLTQQYEWDKSKEVPGVTGAQDTLSGGHYIGADGQPIDQASYDALDPEAKKAYKFQSQFQPFVDAAGQNAVAGSNIAQQYLGGVPNFQEAGQQGLLGYQNLAGLTYDQQKTSADKYAQDYGQGAYDIAAKDINRGAVEDDRNLARQQGRFGALSSQKARGQAYIDQGRTDALLQAGERARQVGYDRSQAELQRQQGLAGSLTSAGTSGLSQASSASALGQGSTTAGINAPFQPYQQYGQTVSAQPTSQVPTYGQTQDPFATGAGLGIQAWNSFQNQGG